MIEIERKTLIRVLFVAILLLFVLFLVGCGDNIKPNTDALQCQECEVCDNTPECEECPTCPQPPSCPVPAPAVPCDALPSYPDGLPSWAREYCECPDSDMDGICDANDNSDDDMDGPTDIFEVVDDCD